MKNVVFTALFVGTLSFVTGASAQSIGVAEKADRTVRGSKSGVLSVDSTVQANERIRVNSSGLGHIRFNDGTKMVVGPGTNLVLDDTIFNPDGSTFRKFSLDTTAGAIRFISGNSSSTSYEIETPAGTLGIRGTAFDLQHLRGRTYILLVSGEVRFCSRSGNCETIERKCDYVVAANNGRISPPVQPRNGIFEVSDMRRYFPFVHDQSEILPDYRLRVQNCDGGGGASANFGVDGPGDGAGPGVGGGAGTDGSPGGTDGGQSGGGDTGGGDTGNGDTGGGDTGGGDTGGGDTGGGDTGGGDTGGGDTGGGDTGGGDTGGVGGII